MLSGTSRLAFFAPSIMVTDTEGLSAQPSSMVNSHCMSSVSSLCVAPLLPVWVLLLVQVVLLAMQGIRREGFRHDNSGLASIYRNGYFAPQSAEV